MPCSPSIDNGVWLMPSLPARLEFGLRGAIIAVLSTVWCTLPGLGKDIVRINVLVPLLAIVGGIGYTRGMAFRISFFVTLSCVGSGSIAIAWTNLFGVSEISLAFCFLLNCSIVYAWAPPQPIQKLWPALSAITLLTQLTIPGAEQVDVLHNFLASLLGSCIGAFGSVVSLPTSQIFAMACCATRKKLRPIINSSSEDFSARLRTCIHLAVTAVETACGSFIRPNPEPVKSDNHRFATRFAPSSPLTHAAVEHMLSLMFSHLNAANSIFVAASWERWQCCYWRIGCKRTISKGQDLDSAGTHWLQQMYQILRLIHLMDRASFTAEKLDGQIVHRTQKFSDDDTHKYQYSQPFRDEFAMKLQDNMVNAVSTIKSALLLCHRVFHLSFIHNTKPSEDDQICMRAQLVELTNASEKLQHDFALSRQNSFHEDQRPSDDNVGTRMWDDASTVQVLHAITSLVFALVRAIAILKDLCVYSQKIHQPKSTTREAKCQLGLCSSGCLQRALSAERLKHTTRSTVACMLAATLALLPIFRSQMRYTHWAAATVAFVIGRSSGSTYQQCVTRVQGTALGSIAGFVAVIAGGGDTLITSVVLGIFVGVCYAAYANGAGVLSDAARVAAFTSGVIALGPGAVEHEAAAEAALARVAQNVLGVIILLIVTIVVFPVRAPDSAWRHLEKLSTLLQSSSSRACADFLDAAKQFYGPYIPAVVQESGEKCGQTNAPEILKSSASAQDLNAVLKSATSSVLIQPASSDQETARMPHDLSESIETTSNDLKALHLTAVKASSIFIEAGMEPMHWRVPFSTSGEVPLCRRVCESANRAARAIAAINQCTMSLLQSSTTIMSVKHTGTSYIPASYTKIVRRSSMELDTVTSCLGAEDRNLLRQRLLSLSAYTCSLVFEAMEDVATKASVLLKTVSEIFQRGRTMLHWKKRGHTNSQDALQKLESLVWLLRYAYYEFEAVCDHSMKLRLYGEKLLIEAQSIDEHEGTMHHFHAHLLLMVFNTTAFALHELCESLEVVASDCIRLRLILQFGPAEIAADPTMTSYSVSWLSEQPATLNSNTTASDTHTTVVLDDA